MNDLSPRRGLSQRETETPTIWLLLGSRRGDTNQLYALARELRLPFEAKALTYNRLRHVPFLRGAGLSIVSRDSRSLINPPWPDLVIGIGYASVGVAREIRRRSGGRTKIVQVGNPRSDVSDLDLVITTPQYWLAPAQNVLALPLPMGNPARDVIPTQAERDWLAAYPRPRRLVAVGGPARYWRLDEEALAHAVTTLQARSAAESGSLIVATSPRTPVKIKALLTKLLNGKRETLVDEFPRFATLLEAADEIHVTADSVSMISEAILTGKAVGMIPIARSTRGRLNRRLRRIGVAPRLIPDFPRFWQMLANEHMVGNVDSPVAAKAEDSVIIAGAAVRRLLRE